MVATEMATVSHRARARNQGRVLLVSDNPMNTAYSTELENAGFAVIDTTRGAAAVIAVKQTRPHLIIADVNLKGIGSNDLAQMLGPSKEPIQLLLIGRAEAITARRQAAMANGAFDYFCLPAEMALLLARTQQLVTIAQTIDSLRAEADRDYLTGLLNRRRLRSALGNEVERWRRQNTPCALLLLDIDFLKKINDHYGHPAGDRVIRHVANVLQDLSRDNDTAARLGGEEFALLLAGADEASANAAAERIRQVVSATEVEGVGTITISLGVAGCPAHAHSERTLYAASDAALYRAKDGGRNRTAVAPRIDSSPPASDWSRGDSV